MSHAEERLPAYPLPEAKFKVVESNDRRGAWVRSWPGGRVHYFPSHMSSDQATCGRFLKFWPEMDWPEGEFCLMCKEAILTALGEGCRD